MTSLSVSGRDVALAGEKLAGHVGWNSFYPFNNAFTSADDTWKQVVDHAASLGSKVVRVPIAPRYKNNLQSYVWTAVSQTYTLRASYIARVTEMLDYALSKGVYLMIVPFWRFPDAADVVGQAVGTIGDGTSLARGYMRQILTQMVAAFGSHAGVAGWCISNEVENYAWGTGGTLPVNTGLGTPASYSLPADHLNLSGVHDWHAESAAIIRAADPQAFIINGHNANSRTAYASVGATYWRCRRVLYPKGMSAVSIHAYWNRDGSARTAESYRALIDRYDQWAGMRPMVIDEIGESLTNDPDGSLAGSMIQAAIDARIPLILDWQLCPTNQDPTFGVWPGSARWDQRASRVVAANSMPDAVKSRASVQPRATRPHFSKVARFGSGGTGQISVPDAPHMNPAVFSACVWVRPFVGTSGGTYRRILEKISTGAYNKGWKLLHYPGSHASNYGPAYGSVFANNGSTAQDVNNNGSIIQGHIMRWAHYALVFDGTNIWTYFNGMPYGNPVAVPGGFAFEPASVPLLIGQSSAFLGELSDVRYFNRPLRQDEIVRTMNGEAVTDGLIGWWPLDGDARDRSRYGNHGEASGTLTFEEKAVSRRALSNDADPWGTL